MGFSVTGLEDDEVDIFLGLSVKVSLVAHQWACYASVGLHISGLAHQWPCTSVGGRERQTQDERPEPGH